MQSGQRPGGKGTPGPCAEIPSPSVGAEPKQLYTGDRSSHRTKDERGRVTADKASVLRRGRSSGDTVSEGPRQALEPSASRLLTA